MAKLVIHKLRKSLLQVKDQVARLEKSLKEVNPIQLVKHPSTTFKRYDPKRRYKLRIQWVLIGSMGDPKTWGGTETVTSMKKGAKDGLAGCLIDLNTL